MFKKKKKQPQTHTPFPKLPLKKNPKTNKPLLAE